MFVSLEPSLGTIFTKV